MLLTPTLLVLTVLLAVVMAFRAPLHWMLLTDLLFVALVGKWSVAGVLLDPSDVFFAAMAVRLAVRRRERKNLLRRRIPYLKIWILLGVLITISYIVVPETNRHLTDPVRVVYQLYRYCWKPILYYPLTFLLLNDLKRVSSGLLMIVLAGNLCALLALPEGLAGVRAGGPFRSGNALGAALTVPLLICVTSFFHRNTRSRLVFLLLSLALLSRAFLYSGSRGAFTGLVVAGACLIWGTLKSRGLRPRLRRLVIVAAIGAIGLLLIKPDLFERPTVNRLLTASQGTQVSTLEWRMEHRWPHFWNIALAHPWFGTGRIVDPTLVGRAGTGHTPHNGYLALAVKHGFPVLILYLVMAFVAIRDCLRSMRDQRDPSRQLLGALIAACLIGVLTHNIVDSLFAGAFLGDIYWMLVALAAIAARPLAVQGHARPIPGTEVPSSISAL